MRGRDEGNCYYGYSFAGFVSDSDLIRLFDLGAFCAVHTVRLELEDPITNRVFGFVRFERRKLWGDLIRSFTSVRFAPSSIFVGDLMQLILGMDDACYLRGRFLSVYDNGNIVDENSASAESPTSVASLPSVVPRRRIGDDEVAVLADLLNTTMGTPVHANRSNESRPNSPS